MLYPAMPTLLEKIENRYLLVNVVAKRSREIAQEADAKGEILESKPVSIAIEEVAEGKLSAHANY